MPTPRTLLLTLAIAATSLAAASPITYTEIFTATGTFNSQSFTDATITLSFTGNTTDIVPGMGGYILDVGSATISVAGIGSANVIEPTEVYVNNSIPGSPAGEASAGIFNTAETWIADTTNTVFLTYDLKSNQAAVLGIADDASGTISTDLGDLVISSSGQASSFGASVAATPEPSSLALLGTGVLGAIGAARRRFLKA